MGCRGRVKQNEWIGKHRLMWGIAGEEGRSDSGKAGRPHTFWRFTLAGGESLAAGSNAPLHLIFLHKSEVRLSYRLLSSFIPSSFRLPCHLPWEVSQEAERHGQLAPEEQTPHDRFCPAGPKSPRPL